MSPPAAPSSAAPPPRAPGGPHAPRARGARRAPPPAHFSRLRADALDVSPDRRAVTVSLPRARPLEPRVDPARSRVFERERGLIDRLGGVFEDNPTSERELYLLAERKLAAAARDTASGLVPSAERNTRVMLEGLMRGLGFERVAVRFG